MPGCHHLGLDFCPTKQPLKLLSIPQEYGGMDVPTGLCLSDYVGHLDHFPGEAMLIPLGHQNDQPSRIEGHQDDP